MKNDLIEKKLNLIQKLRINLATRFPRKGKFFSYPDYVRDAKEVIDAYFEKGYGKELIQELGREDYGRLAESFGQRENIYEHMSDDEKRDLFEGYGNKEILIYVDKKSLLGEYSLDSSDYKYLYLRTNDMDYLMGLSKEARGRQEISELVREGQIPQEQVEALYDRTKNNTFLPFLPEKKILQLGIDGELKKDDYKKLNTMGDLLKAKLVYLNPKAFLDLNIQDEEVLSKLARKVDLNEVISTINSSERTEFINSRENILKYLDKSNIQKYVVDIIRQSKNNPEAVINLGSTLVNKGISSELIESINLKYATTAKYEFYLGVGRNIIERNFQEKDESEITDIKKAFEECIGKKTGNEREDIKIEQEVTEKYFNILKLLNNERVIERVSKEDIINYMDSNMSYESICNIVEKAYGEKAVSILRERPGLGIIDIPNFDIFEPEIMDLIGYGGVHTYLTYFMESKDVITEMVENPKMIEEYKKYRDVVKDFYPPSAIGLEDTMLSFRRHYDLLSQTFEGEITDELKENILLMLRDEEFFDNDMEVGNVDIDNNKRIPKPKKITTVEQLSKYKEIRNAEYDNLIRNSKTDQKRKLILAKYFGYISDSPGEYNSYDHKKFLEDYLTFNGTEFSDYELDSIELYDIISGINDDQVLEMFNEYLEQSQVISPVDMKSIDSKVIESYKKEYLDSILSIQEAERMINSDRKSEKYIEKSDGRKIYKDRIVSGKDTLYNRLSKNGELIQLIQTSAGKKYKCGNRSYEIRVDEDGKEIEEGNKDVLELFEDGQVLENSMVVEDGDVEIYELYDVDKQISVHAVRQFTSADFVKEHPELGITRYGGAYELENNDAEIRIMMEKNLEHGIASRSMYYAFDTEALRVEVGYGYTSLDPNSIIGFYIGDARTSHGLKRLRVSMNTLKNSEILSASKKAYPRSSEIATLRYEYDISKINPNTRGGRNEMDFIFATNAFLKEAKKHAIAFSKPIIHVNSQKQLTNSERPKVRQERGKSEFIQNMEKIADGDER